jgi:hypothetical protein
MYLSGATTPPATGLAGATLQATVSLTPGSYQLRLFASGGLTKLATSSAVTVQATATITLSTPSVAPGAAITFTVADGFAHVLDWVGVYKPTDADASPRSWMYLSGTTTPPSTGVSLTTLQATAPLSTGAYELRLFASGGLTRLGTSSTIQVQP